MDLATQPLLSNRTAINDSNDGVDDDECPLPNVGSIGELDAAPPRDPTCRLMGDGLDPATQLLLSNLTAVTNGNDGAANDECFLLNVSSMGEPNAPPRDP